MRDPGRSRPFPCPSWPSAPLTALVAALGGICLLSGVAACDEGLAGTQGAVEATESVAAETDAWKVAEDLESQWRARGTTELLDQAVAAFRRVDGARRCEARLAAETMLAEQSGQLGPLRDLVSQLQAGEPALSVSARCKTLAKSVLNTLGAANSTTSAPVEETAELAEAPRVSATEGLRVTRVERYGSQDSARIAIFLTEPAVYEVGQLPRDAKRGPRLFVDIEGAEYEGKMELPVGGLVERVRVGHQEQGIRVVLDLRERVYKHIFYLPEPFRLIVDVSKTPPKLAVGPEKGQRNVRRVVLDPGHGGHDPGAIGNSGLQEKDVALDVALRAAPLIARELGISTLLTRDTDQFVPLDERVAKANAFMADLFVSVHCNASESSDNHGVMTFVLDESPDPIAQRIAARENAASTDAGERLASAMKQVMGTESLLRSAHFAQLLQRASVASLLPSYPDVKDGGVRRAGFYVLAGAQMPAVLFEASFISNAQEEQRLDSAGYRQKLADALVNAIRAYRDGL